MLILERPKNPVPPPKALREKPQKNGSGHSEEAGSFIALTYLPAKV
jgi:hypothetical protein